MEPLPTPFFGRISERRINLVDRAGFSDLIHQLEGETVEIRLGPVRNRQRTMPQNDYFHYLCGEICKAAGYFARDLPDVKQALCRSFLWCDPGRDDPPATHTLTTTEFSLLIEHTLQFAWEAFPNHPFLDPSEAQILAEETSRFRAAMQSTPRHKKSSVGPKADRARKVNANHQTHNHGSTHERGVHEIATINQF